MAKNSIDVYGAKGKGNALDFDPDTLVLVTNPSHPLFDERVHWPVDENMVRNIMFHGVIQPIEVTKDPETGEVQAVTGRQRVKAAREANRRLIDRGEPPVTVPGIVRRLAKDERASVLSAAMASENAIRQQETPLSMAAKMARQLRMRSEDDVAILFGCSVQVVRATVALLDCCEDVQKAVDAGQIKVTHARTLAKLEPAEQRAKVKEVIAAGEGKQGHERSRAQKAALTGNAAPRMRTRKQIAAELEKAAGERADALRWVLGLEDATQATADVDSRQMSIDEAA
ncbi:ParB/RepB/Spo0J family partition protein [Burkholderia sp. PU8-34]